MHQVQIYSYISILVRPNLYKTGLTIPETTWNLAIVKATQVGAA